jgi:hypothetical protein
MAATTYAIPAVAVLLSWAFLGEVPGWLTLAGGAACVAGVALARRAGGSPGQRAARPEASGAAGPDAPVLSAAEPAPPVAAKDQQ